MQTLLIATHNRGKLREYRMLLRDLDLNVINLDDANIGFDVEETGKTFRENAVLKARTYAEATGCDHLGRRLRAGGRCAGRCARRLLCRAMPGPTRPTPIVTGSFWRDLATLPGAARTARFRCVVALVLGDGSVYTRDGTVEGRIVDRPRGNDGFGYDPVFLLPELGCTMAELTPDVKNRISHRGLAASQSQGTAC